MVVVLTSMARTRDWRALARLNRDGLLGRMREAGATRYRIPTDFLIALLAAAVLERVLGRRLRAP